MRFDFIDRLEARHMLAADIPEFRTFDGTENNLENPKWGSVGVDLIRLSSSDYGDEISTPAGQDRKSPRLISNKIASHVDEEEVLNDRGMSAFMYAFGQLLDHDLDLTTFNNIGDSSEPLFVNVPKGDPFFDPNNTGRVKISFHRSGFNPDTGETIAREHPNRLTAFIDASVVYGSDKSRNNALRTFENGLLKVSEGDLLPFNTESITNANDPGLLPDEQLFIAGDVRANENIELTSLHTLFVREHNRLATILKEENSDWDDELLFQTARKLVSAELQHITYTQYLPMLLGKNALSDYDGYNPNVNPGIATEFSTAAFRVGHTMLADDVEFFDDNGVVIEEELELAHAFFNPAVVEEFGIDPILKYLASSQAEEIDNQVVNGVRNFLFGEPGQGGFDLPSLNIQRGRDHGIADFNTVRESIGLDRVDSFDDITSDKSLQKLLEKVYWTIDNIDLWVGGIVEDHVEGSSVGETFHTIIVDQFERTRDGDRFWYETDLSSGEWQLIEGVTLGKVIQNNTGVTNLQKDVFSFNATLEGVVFEDKNGDGVNVVHNPFMGVFNSNIKEPGLKNKVVELLDDADEIVDTAITDNKGRFSFSNVPTGVLKLKMQDDPSFIYTKDGEFTEVHVTRGQHIDNLSLGYQRV